MTDMDEAMARAVDIGEKDVGITALSTLFICNHLSFQLSACPIGKSRALNVLLQSGCFIEYLLIAIGGRRR